MGGIPGAAGQGEGPGGGLALPPTALHPGGSGVAPLSLSFLLCKMRGIFPGLLLPLKIILIIKKKEDKTKHTTRVKVFCKGEHLL